jgi:hypothetical protein
VSAIGNTSARTTLKCWQISCRLGELETSVLRKASRLAKSQNLSQQLEISHRGGRRRDWFGGIPWQHPHRHTPFQKRPHYDGRTSDGRVSPGVHLIGVHLIGVHLISVHLMCMNLTGVHLMGVHLMSMHLTGVSHGPAPQQHAPHRCIPYGQETTQKASRRRKRKRYRSQQPRNKSRPYLQRWQGWQERRRPRIGARGTKGNRGLSPALVKME